MNEPTRNSWFPTTRWTMVLSASPTESMEALESLCQSYWYPVYVYIRRQGFSVDQAKDATQGFFHCLLRRDSLRHLVRNKGRFRSYLIGAIHYYLADEHAKETAQKRGGGSSPIELDALEAEERYQWEPTTAPDAERLFDQGWARTVLERGLKRLEQSYRESGRGPLFDQLQGWLSTDPPATAYASVGHSLGMSEGAVKTAVHRLRQRYRECCREEVAQSVAEPKDIDDELRYLCEIVGAQA